MKPIKILILTANPTGLDEDPLRLDAEVRRIEEALQRSRYRDRFEIAAKLAVGYHLHEIPNDITRKTPASFEPAIDYVVVKIPRWDFEKFPDEDPRLTSQMKSIGEAMGIGRTFKEALNKTLRSLENGWCGFHADGTHGYDRMSREELLDDLRSGTPDRILKIWQALKSGISREEISEISGTSRSQTAFTISCQIRFFKIFDENKTRKASLSCVQLRTRAMP